MKKLLFLLLAALLLCSVSACTDKSALPDDAAVEETPAQQIDYTVFCGNYSDTETVEGPCYTVSITSADNEAKTIEIIISYVGINSSPVYNTEPISVSFENDNRAEFEWEDSWGNSGVGTLVLNPDDTSAVRLLMTVTEEAEVNRATLSTSEQYKTLARRQD